VEVPVGNLLERDAKEPGHEAIDSKGVGRGQHLAFSRAGKGVVAELNNLVGAAAEDHVVTGQAVKFGDGVPQRETAAIRIKVSVKKTVPDGLQGGGGWTERVLVGGELGDLGGIEAVLAGDVGDGATGLVGDELLDVGVGAGIHFGGRWKDEVEGEFKV
jgi:hypothetical protein